MKNKLLQALGPLLKITTVVLLAILPFVILKAPDELQIQKNYKLIYLHVPLAWWGLFGLFSVFLSSILYLKTKKNCFDRWTKIATESSLLFCILALLTGSIWAKLVWGVWWTFEPKLTTTFVVCLVYSLCVVIRSLQMAEKTKKLYVSILSILGFLDVPFIFLAAKFGTGAHPKIIAAGSDGLPSSMLIVLLYSIISFGFAWASITLIRLKKAGPKPC